MTDSIDVTLLHSGSRGKVSTKNYRFEDTALKRGKMIRKKIHGSCLCNSHAIYHLFRLVFCPVLLC